MARKHKGSDDQEKQLSLFEKDDLNSEQSDDSEDSWVQDDDLGFGFETSNRKIEPQQTELLTLKLLREAIQTQNPEDPVMSDFAECVLPNLLRVAIGVTAKGGKFFDEIDQRREAQGKKRVRRDNAADQSLCTHLLNGLFPANLIEQHLEKLDTTVRREMVRQEIKRRLLIAGFILHDFEKFKYDSFVRMPQKYKDIQKDNKIRELSLLEHREIIDVIATDLSLDCFISPDNPEAYREYLDDLLCIASTSPG